MRHLVEPLIKDNFENTKKELKALEKWIQVADSLVELKMIEALIGVDDLLFAKNRLANLSELYKVLAVLKSPYATIYQKLAERETIILSRNPALNTDF